MYHRFGHKKREALVLIFIESYVTLLEEARADSEVVRNHQNNPSVIQVPPNYKTPSLLSV